MQPWLCQIRLAPHNLRCGGSTAVAACLTDMPAVHSISKAWWSTNLVVVVVRQLCKCWDVLLSNNSDVVQQMAPAGWQDSIQASTWQATI